MAWDVAAVAADEAGALAGFLEGVFGTPDGFSNAALLRWKYFDPHPDWSGPRSWSIRDEGKIVAHTGVWPLRMRLPGGATVESMHVIDWAADPSSPGAGVALYLDTIARTPTLFGIGGSGMGRKVVRKLGIREVGEVGVWARVARPWEQFRRRPAGPAWKNAAKLGRNLWWGRSSPKTSWTTQAAAQFPASLGELRAAPPRQDCVAFERSVETLNYILRCPVDRCSGFLLFDGERLRGYCVLSRVGPQARIAGLWIDGVDALEWGNAYAAAASAAAADPEVVEIVAFASTAFTGAALEGNGFRRILEKPVWLADPQGLLRDAPPLDVQQLESDAFFLGAGTNPFLT